MVHVGEQLLHGRVQWWQQFPQVIVKVRKLLVPVGKEPCHRAQSRPLGEVGEIKVHLYREATPWWLKLNGNHMRLI